VERYVIRGGRQGYDRLLVLSHDHWPNTSALLSRARIVPGMSCVDLGCGGGEVTLEIARLVCPGGTVKGIDVDPVKLELGRQVAMDRGITNVRFENLNVNDWDEHDCYDVAYSRFLLHHLGRPLDLVERMWDAVRVGGSIIVEDADHDGWYCHPPNEGFEFFVRSFKQVLDRAGGDHAFGRKLYGCFLEAGIPEPEVRLVQSARVSGEAKEMAWLTLDGIKDSIVSYGLAFADEVEWALDELRRLTDDPGSLIGAPRVFQVWAKRIHGRTS
jgi:ubiquinone/menaquinone biosynthesis C-methylase UbiE